jgi:hypothetical protein
MPRRTLRQRLVLAALIIVTPLNLLALSTLVYLLTRSTEVELLPGLARRQRASLAVPDPRATDA